jgi:cell division protein FtsZ
MIELPANPAQSTPLRLAVVGLGSAGCNVLDRIVLDGLPAAELVAVNTDVQALSGSVAPAKVQIGQIRTRGLGAGGDPEVGTAAAQEGLDDVLGAIGQADAVAFLVGLGGGTGSGALHVLTEAAKERDMLVIVIATLPFGFEGNRRRIQALDALAAIEGTADLLICFENDRMSELVSAKTGIREAFAQVDQTLAEAVRSLVALAGGRGLLHAGLAEVSAAFAGEGLRALFGVGEAHGDNRAHTAVELALKSPLLDRGRSLRDAESVVVHLAGGNDLTLHETQTAMDEVRKQLPENANVFCGLVVDPALGAKLRVTILASTYIEVAAEAETAPSRPAPVARLERTARVQPPIHSPARVKHHHEDPLELSVEMRATPVEEPEPELEPEPEPEILASAEPEEEEPAAPEPEPAPVAPRPRMRPLFAPIENIRRTPTASIAGDAITGKTREEKQEQMQFEPVHSGRFEKSEPTIVDGQNLDIPTFMRRNVRVE